MNFQFTLDDGIFLFRLWITFLFLSTLVAVTFSILAGVVVTRVLKPAKRPIPKKETGTALVTGAGTGFGHLISLDLAREHYHVFAGVLTKEEGDNLRSQLDDETKKYIHPLILDITKQDQINAAFEKLRQELVQLQGPNSLPKLNMLVNNAGIAVAAPVEVTSFDDFFRVVDVDLLGQVRITQQALPLLRAAAPEARIVCVTSIAGRFASPLMSAYNAAKFGFEGFSDALRREVNRLGISVSIIEPGFAKTAIISSGMGYLDRRMQEYFPDDEVGRLGKKLYELDVSGDKLTGEIASTAMDPQVVVDVIVRKALLGPNPRTRYPVGYQAKTLTFISHVVPDHVADWFTDFVFPWKVKGIEY